MELTDKILIVTSPAPGSTTDGATYTAITLQALIDIIVANEDFDTAVNALIAAAA